VGVCSYDSATLRWTNVRATFRSVSLTPEAAGKPVRTTRLFTSARHVPAVKSVKEVGPRVVTRRDLQRQDRVFDVTRPGHAAVVRSRLCSPRGGRRMRGMSPVNTAPRRRSPSRPHPAARCLKQTDGHTHTHTHSRWIYDVVAGRWQSRRAAPPLAVLKLDLYSTPIRLQFDRAIRLFYSTALCPDCCTSVYVNKRVSVTAASGYVTVTLMTSE